MPAPIRTRGHALAEGALESRLAGRRPAVFLDYDGTLTPIVDRPEDAVISEAMRATVRALAARCPVCVVSGRDRPVVQRLMGVDDLIVAGSHGFDIWDPRAGALQRTVGEEFAGVLADATARLQDALAGVEGAFVEPKRSSVAVHYRLVADADRSRVHRAVEDVLAAHRELRRLAGKMVHEVQPRLDWDKGKAVLYLLETLGLDRGDVVPLYLGDDVTDEDAFRVLAGRGVGIFVGRADDPEVADRPTAAELVLASPDEVESFLRALERRIATP